MNRFDFDSRWNAWAGAQVSGARRSWHLTADNREDGNGFDFWLQSGSYSASLQCAQGEGSLYSGSGDQELAVPAWVLDWAGRWEGRHDTELAQVEEYEQRQVAALRQVAGLGGAQ